MVAGFSGYGLTNYISAYYTWRLSSGSMPVNPRLLQSGAVKFAGDRVGDYCATSLDPIDDWSFWTVQEYATTAQVLPGVFVNRWGTVVARINPNP